MPAKSEQQRKAAGAALAVRRGERPTSSLMGASKSMLSMSTKQLRDYARKPRTTREVAGLGKAKEHKKGNPHPKAKSSTAVRTTGATAGSTGVQSTRRPHKERSRR